MPSTAAYLSNKSSLFFQLPTEIRHDVYGHVFPCSTFRSVVGSSGPSVPSTSAVALLMTCHAIHQEATPFFYREARIHFSMTWQRLQQSIDRTPIRLPLLVHVSLDFCCLSLHEEYEDNSERMKNWHNNPGRYRFPTAEVEEAVDRQFAHCIDAISTNCPLLQSFTLHLLPCKDRHYVEDHFKDILQEVLKSAESCSRPSYTIDSLKKLKVRDTIVVVAAAIDELITGYHTYRNVRDAIAPSVDWGMLVLSEWPGISLTRDQNMGVKALMVLPEDYVGRSLRPNANIHLWYYQPPGSKALVLPDHKLLGDE